jgi:hypothetical protein
VQKATVDADRVPTQRRDARLHVALHVGERVGTGAGERHVGLLDRGEQRGPRVHLAHEVVHLRERARRLVHDDIDAVVDGFEVGVGDEHCDLDDDMARDVETGHLEVEPDEHVVGSRRVDWCFRVTHGRVRLPTERSVARRMGSLRSCDAGRCSTGRDSSSGR